MSIKDVLDEIIADQISLLTPPPDDAFTAYDFASRVQLSTGRPLPIGRAKSILSRLVDEGALESDLIYTEGKFGGKYKRFYWQVDGGSPQPTKDTEDTEDT